MSFGVSDYYRMYKAKGIRMPYYYFFENHFFDLWWGVDTHKRLRKEDYGYNPVNFEHGVLYMSSWTRVVQRASRIVFDSVKTKTPWFIDVGCGKGKVLCVWGKLFKNDEVNLLGIEYSPELLAIADKNLQKMGTRNYELICSDICELNFDFLENPCVFYLFNPFDAQMMLKFINKITGIDCFVIYNNPVHERLFSAFEQIHKEHSWHDNLNFNIYRNQK